MQHASSMDTEASVGHWSQSTYFHYPSYYHGKFLIHAASEAQMR